ncbi:response regulator transcription factor [Micrococcales bacterium 31B]|nr:response regulator transcription factor [Micrococcales bacterium 31B]
MSLTILAVDDEPPALREIVYALRGSDPTLTVLQAPDATGALRSLRETHVDAVFLDINMPGLTGLELAEVLGQFARPPLIVFVTALDEHAVEAFEIGVCDYIVKPFRPERVTRALTKVQEAAQRRGQARERATEASSPPVAAAGGLKIAAERGGETRFLGPAEVFYAEANGDYVRLFTGAEHFLVRTTLADLEARWSAAFVRAHRAYLVRLDAIAALRNDAGRHSIVVRARPAEVEIPVSRRNAREIREAMARMHLGHTS